MPVIEKMTSAAEPRLTFVTKEGALMCHEFFRDIGRFNLMRATDALR